MAGETPDDIDDRRRAGIDSAAKAIASAFSQPVPPVVPRDLPREPQRVSDAGQYRELRVDVDNLKAGFNDLRHSIDERFKEQAAESRSMHQEMLQRLDRQNDSQNNSKLTLEKGATVVGVIASVILSLVWGYSQMQTSSITDKITFTNDKIARDAATTAEDVQRIEKAIGTLSDNLVKRADKVDARFEKFVDDTVPRRELENRFNREDATVASLSKTVNENLVPRTEFEKRVDTIREDIGTLKDDTLKRADLDGRFADFTKRLDLISNRVEQLQSTSAGTAILQEQLREAQSQIKEIREQLWPKAITTPRS